MTDTIPGAPRLLLTERRVIATTPTNAPTYRQCLPAFGWRLIESESSGRTLTFERELGLPRRSEVAALQREFEAGLSRITRLERVPKRLGFLTSASIGLLGVAAVAGSVFAFLAAMYPLFVVACGIGALLCGLPAFVHSHITEFFDAAAADRLDHEYAALSEIYASAKELSDARTAASGA